MSSAPSSWCRFLSPTKAHPSGRPAVVVSNRAYNSAKPDVIVMAVTSQFHPVPGLAEVWLAEWRSAGLLKPSAIKPVFATIEQRLIIRQLGVL